VDGYWKEESIMGNKDYDLAVSQYAGILEALKALYDERDRTLSIIWRHMEEAGAKYLMTPDFEVSIPTKRQYDVGKFASKLGEVLEPTEMAKVYQPEHTVQKVVPAKVDGTAAKKLWGMGDDVKAILTECLIPQKPEVKLKARKKEQAL
jgi:hypothetical protein